MAEIVNVGVMQTGTGTVTVAGSVAGHIGRPAPRRTRTAAEQVRHVRATLARLIQTADEQLNHDDRDRQYLIEELLSDLTDLVNDLDHP
ncbi:hypothetical protein [Planosporangium mesophilum]|uniref:Uncharacterized protein n=1 Tax=Planosporangium mesophilum TaxID=689768 RepID=A0A8J3T910_9ACTN|nr:hypothetical protein [Planosporangium mesophilum]NJC81496.1 hypothetical protein [Planosporangium mesophilum]GII20847.1 hypothetical protein Pme01_04440 [Planosporangium mesophilum]